MPGSGHNKHRALVGCWVGTECACRIESSSTRYLHRILGLMIDQVQLYNTFRARCNVSKETAQQIYFSETFLIPASLLRDNSVTSNTTLTLTPRTLRQQNGRQTALALSGSDSACFCCNSNWLRREFLQRRSHLSEEDVSQHLRHLFGRNCNILYSSRWNYPQRSKGALLHGKGMRRGNSGWEDDERRVLLAASRDLRPECRSSLVSR